MGHSIREDRPRINGGDRQPWSTELNQAQPQRDFGGVAEVRPPVFIDWRLVAMCEDGLAAVNLCIDLSRRKDEWLALALGIDKGHWSRIRKGMAHFPDAKRLDLMRLCGNWVPVQFEMLNGPTLARVADEIAGPVRSHHPAASRGWMGAA